VPELGISVLADKADDLMARVVSHIRFALFRTDQARSLWTLTRLQRGIAADLRAENPVVRTKTPKQLAQQDSHRRLEKEASTLEAIGTNLCNVKLPQAYGLEERIARVVEALKGPRTGSVLLVGPSGAGKTALFHQLVRRRAALGLSGRQFFTTSGARLISGMGGFGMWQKRCQAICREAVERGAILHVENLIELMEVGKSDMSSLGIASFLKSYLVSGELIMIVECRAEDLAFIEAEDPHLLQVFHRIDVEEPDEACGREILLNVALEYSPGEGDVIALDAIEHLDRLHRRYATYSAYPGRPIRFLKNLIRDADPGVELKSSDVMTAFARETGLPLSILDEERALDLEETRAWFEERLVGQPEAIRQVVNLIAQIKTRLSRPGKPLASFFFAGPTGVGKTEMAKVLAEFLFGDRNRLLRFDMSEYADPSAAVRLIAGSARGEGQLTGRIREQPFSVVLLDEFEKSDPAVHDLLLQVLGEGRLSDAAGRTADFCNSVLIMTSNLGAETFSSGSLGFGKAEDLQENAVDHFTGEIRKALRPEMYNRIDAVIAFVPLDSETVRRITKREIDLIRSRDGLLLRDIELEIGADVAAHLAREGFDPRLGARPIKRAIDDMLVVPLADRLNAFPVHERLEGSIQVDDNRLAIVISADSSARKRHGPSQASRSTLAIVENWQNLRRQLKALAGSSAVQDLENEIFQLERQNALLTAKKSSRRSLKGLDSASRQKLQLFGSMANELVELQQQAIEHEDRTLKILYWEKNPFSEEGGQSYASLRRRLDRLLLQLEILSYQQPDHALVTLFGDNEEWLLQLAAAYVAVALAGEGGRVKAESVCLGHNQRTGKRELIRTKTEDLETFFANPPRHVIGVLLNLKVSAGYPHFCAEAGRHVLQRRRKTYDCMVQILDVAPEEYKLPEGLELTRVSDRDPVRRTYNCDYGKVIDSHLSSREKPFHLTTLHHLLRDAMHEQLLEKARQLIHS